MPRYTYAYLRDYFSARGLTLEKLPHGGDYLASRGYTLTNGKRVERFGNLKEVAERAARP